MSFIKPMLAAPMPESFSPSPGEWASEQKYDGHRLLVDKYDELIVAWSRNEIQRILPAHISKALQAFPQATYDGELTVPGQRSYGVTELLHGPKLVYVVFDILTLLGTNTMDLSYDDRRALLTEIFSRPHCQSSAVILAESHVIHSKADIKTRCEEVWARDGEGLILKRRAGIYRPGKRSKDFLKLKQLRPAVLTVIGFEPSKGQIVNRGPYATVVLQDDDGNYTSVKTLNDAELAKFEAQCSTAVTHPAIGRKLRIEYQERTPKDARGNIGYRHPRWDRWEDE